MTNLINFIKNISSLLFIIFGIIMGVRLTKSNQQKDTLNNVRIARKVEQKNDKLTRDELIDKL